MPGPASHLCEAMRGKVEEGKQETFVRGLSTCTFLPAQVPYDVEGGTLDGSEPKNAVIPSRSPGKSTYAVI